MTVSIPHHGDVVVTFVRIGHDRNIPVLEIPAAPMEIVKKTIHAFVAEHLQSEQFTVQLWNQAGFIDLGTHSAGAFTIYAADAGAGPAREETISSRQQQTGCP